MEIHSLKGGQCQVKNPWPELSATVYRNGKRAESISGTILVVKTIPGETVTIVSKGKGFLLKEVK